MSTILNEVLIANQQYSVAFGDKANLALPPARRFAVLTCMDARLDPAKFAGLAKTRHAKLMGSSTLRVRTIAERSRLFSE
jgi:hypothetical protein